MIRGKCFSSKMCLNDSSWLLPAVILCFTIIFFPVVSYRTNSYSIVCIVKSKCKSGNRIEKHITTGPFQWRAINR